MNLKAYYVLLAFTASLLLPVCGQSKDNTKDSFMDNKTTDTTQKFTSGHSLVNGIKMYYEIHGTGRPLVLIHGGGSTLESTFAKVIPMFAETRQVIAVELQAHGRTEDRDAPVSFEQDADDVAALLRNLHIDSADVFGFSNGANTTMQLAIRHPKQVRKIILASGFYKREGIPEAFWKMMPGAPLSSMPADLQEAYRKVAPDPSKLEVMHHKDRDRMVNFKDWPDEYLTSIKAPTLIIASDKDVMTVEHAVAMSRLIPDCRLAILPGGHGEYIGEISFKKPSPQPAFTVAMINEFLGD